VRIILMGMSWKYGVRMWSYVDRGSVQTRVIRNRAMGLRDTQLYVGKFGYLSYIN
jgi:hypothetical protein